jgi:hypothetical protein
MEPERRSKSWCSAAGAQRQNGARDAEDLEREQDARRRRINKAGGGGSLAYSYMGQKAGDAHFVVVAQAGLITNRISGLSPISYTDLTPLASSGTSRSGSPCAPMPFKTVGTSRTSRKIRNRCPSRLAARAAQSITSLCRSFSHRRRSEAAQDPVFGGVREATTNLLAAISAPRRSPSTTLFRTTSGQVAHPRSARRSVRPLPDVPTFRENGFDVVMEGWTIFRTERLHARAVAYWEGILAKTVQHPEWKQYCVQFVGMGLQELTQRSIPEEGRRTIQGAAHRARYGQTSGCFIWRTADAVRRKTA